MFSLYKSLLLHTSLLVLGSALSLFFKAFALGCLLHALAVVSYVCDSTRRAYLLRRLFAFKPSQNLLATIPAASGREPALRIVLPAHAGAVAVFSRNHPYPTLLLRQTLRSRAGCFSTRTS